MAIFRKKPVEIEAVLIDTSSNDMMTSAKGKLEVEDFLDRHRALDQAYWRGPSLIIKTLEGDMVGRPGDWLIRGVSGEFYPCKPDIFEATYEFVRH